MGFHMKNKQETENDILYAVSRILPNGDLLYLQLGGSLELAIHRCKQATRKYGECQIEMELIPLKKR